MPCGINVSGFYGAKKSEYLVRINYFELESITGPFGLIISFLRSIILSFGSKTTKETLPYKKAWRKRAMLL